MTMDNQRGAMEIFDTDVNPTKREELIKIIRWAAELGDEAESQSLELKSQLSFERTGGARTKSFAKIIKFILGASNRDEYKAAKAFQGYGVMLIGLADGEIVGIESALPEEHEFREHAKAYFGPTAPKFEYFPVDVDGKKILVIVVDPPQNGQPIYICSKDFNPQDEKDKYGKTKKSQDALRDGVVYYRESSSTKAATSDQLRELFERYRGGMTKADVNVIGAAFNYAVDIEEEKAFWQQRADKNVKDIQEKIQKESESSGFIYNDISKFSYEEIADKVSKWEERFWDSLQTTLLFSAPMVHFEIFNAGTNDLQNTTIQFRFPTKVLAAPAQDDYENAPIHFFFPDIVEKERFSLNYFNSKSLSNVENGFETTGDENTIIWKVGDVAPKQTETSFAEKAVLMAHTSDTEIFCEWRLTASNLSEPITGILSMPVLQIDDWMALRTAVEDMKRIGE